MTKNISSKGHNRGGHPKGAVDKKSQQHPNSNATPNSHSQNENASAATVVISVQKASIDLKMLTPEQRRLASLMNDKVDVSEIEKKINKIMDITGASKDKAIVALHDCANELDKAIDMILEGDSINESEWKSQARKKKPKVGTLPITGGKESSLHLNGDAKKGSAGVKGRQMRSGKQQTNNIQQSEGKPFSQQNNNRRGTSDRSERRPRGEWKPREQQDSVDPNDEPSSANHRAAGEIELDDKLDEWTDEATTQQSTREPQQRDRVRRENDGQFSRPHNKYPNSTQDGRRISSGPRVNYNRDRNRDGPNQFGSGGDRRERRETNDRMTERRPYQSKIYNTKKPSYTNSIDTWSNLTATDNTSNDYAQMTVGNWSDVVSSNSAVVVGSVQSELNNDEWVEPTDNANLIDQAKNKVVFSKDSNQAVNVVSSTASKPDDQLSKIPNLASIVSGGGVKAVSQQQQPTITNVHKSPSSTQQQATSKQPQQILSTSNNQSLLNKSAPQPQRQPPQTNQSQQSQNKIDLAALLKSSQQQSTNHNLIRGNIQQQQRSNQPDSNAYGAAILQSLQQRVVNPDQDATLGKTAASTNLNDYVNPYNQNTNKNLVHNIPSANYNAQQNAPPNLFDNQSHHSLHHHQNVSTDQKLLIEKKRRQTKIPETAVEMPNSEHISSLNVQFGALDFSSAADSYAHGLNDDQITGKQTQFNLRENTNEKQTMNPTTLLGTVRGQQSNESNKQAKDSLLQNIDSHHHSSHHQHQLQDNILQQHNDSRAHNKPHHHQQSSSGYVQLNPYNANKNETSNQHSSIYPPNLQNYQNYQSYGSVNNYSSQNHGNNSASSNVSNTAHSSNAASNPQQQQQQQQQKSINLKDLSSDQTSSTNQNNNTTSTNNATSTSGSALGNLVNSTTVTTNVLKNSLTATGKAGGLASGNSSSSNMQQLGVAPNVAPPLLGTPQYIMSQPGLSTAFYPVYDMPMAADHSFRYNQNTQDVKYNRSDAQDSQVGQSNHGNPVQSTQAPVTQTPNHQIFSQFPPYFFYTGVNMMTQGLYQTPFLPVQPNPSGNVNQSPHQPNSNQQHSTHSTGFGPKGTQNQAYSTSYASSTGYDPITGHQLTQGQDFSKQNYASVPQNSNQSQQQSGKHSQHSQMSTGGSNDLVNNNMYTKSHAQLAKNFDKPNAFQTGTPPPFGIATLGTLNYNPNPFIPMIQPQSNPSMLHHSLQGDANQNVNNSGVSSGGQRGGGSQVQKNSASNSKNYYNWS